LDAAPADPRASTFSANIRITLWWGVLRKNIPTFDGAGPGWNAVYLHSFLIKNEYKFDMDVGRIEIILIFVL
jgi:hypothetical protein